MRNRYLSFAACWLLGILAVGTTTGCSGDSENDVPVTGTPAPVSEADEVFVED